MAAGLAIAAVLVVVLPALFLATGALACALLGESLSAAADEAPGASGRRP